MSSTRKTPEHLSSGNAYNLQEAAAAMAAEAAQFEAVEASAAMAAEAALDFEAAAAEAAVAEAAVSVGRRSFPQLLDSSAFRVR
jgi:hypothetical protein